MPEMVTPIDQPAIGHTVECSCGAWRGSGASESDTAQAWKSHLFRSHNPHRYDVVTFEGS